MPLSRLYAGFLDLLYPRRCPVCSEIVMPKGNLICPDCMEKLAFVRRPVCKCCGKEIISPEAEYCFDCTRHPHSFDSGMALINYNDTASRSMALIKYHGRREYLDFYSEAMFRRFGPAIRRLSPDCIIPVPVHKSRLKKRGFNQAEIVAKVLSENTGIAMDAGAVKRIKATSPQKELGDKGRKRNIRGAFAVQKNVKGENIVLIDDIYTTGSTLDEAARVLKKAGAENVYFLTVSIGQGI